MKNSQFIVLFNKVWHCHDSKQWIKDNPEIYTSFAGEEYVQLFSDNDKIFVRKPIFFGRNFKKQENRAYVCKAFKTQFDTLALAGTKRYSLRPSAFYQLEIADMDDLTQN